MQPTTRCKWTGSGPTTDWMDSLESRFGTNYVPTDEDITHIRSLIQEPRTEAQSLADEITRHTQILASLEEKQKAYTDFIHKHTALLAPIRRLPLEVLQSIFLLCLPKDQNPSLATKDAPFLLCHVCHRWRDVVFRTPLLWTRIHLHIPIFPEVPISYKGLRSSRDSGRLLESDQLAQEEIDLYEETVSRWNQRMDEYREAVVAWFTRAAKCPLEISLQQSPNVSDASKGKEAQDKILQAICSFSSQWKTLQVHAPIQVASAILSINKGRVPVLEKVAIQWDISYRERMEAAADTPEPPIPEVRIFRAPNLKRLSLQNVPYPLRHFPLHFDRLTELILGKFAEPNRDAFAPRPVLFPNRALDILARCPNLVRCRLTLGKTYARQLGVVGSVVPEGETREIVSVPHLEFLSINEGNPIFDFFAYLDLPALKEVVFKTSQYPRANSRSPLLPLFQKHGDNIRKVILDDSMLSVRDLEESFRLLPNLTDLKLTRTSYVRVPYDRASPPETNFVVGHLSARIWDKITPRIPELGSTPLAGTLSSSLAPTVTVPEELLLPNLVSFSCRLHAPELVQHKVVHFLRARRHPSLSHLSSSSSSPLLQHFSVMFYSTEPEQKYKNITEELDELGVDVKEMKTFEVRHRRTYGDSLLGPNDFVVKPLLQPKWPTTGDRPGMFFGVEDVYEEDE